MAEHESGRSRLEASSASSLDYGPANGSAPRRQVLASRSAGDSQAGGREGVDDMQAVTFYGRVLPERANVNLGAFTFHGARLSDDSKSFVARVVIEWSQVIVRVSEVRLQVDLPTLKETVAHLVRVLIATIGYTNGCGYEVEIESSMDDAGAHMVYGVQAIELGEAVDGRMVPIREGLSELALSGEGICFRRAILDLQAAARQATDSSFYCYRAIESVMQHFRDGGSEKKTDAWEQMRAALRVHKSWIDRVKPAADVQRHGEFVFEVSAPGRREALFTAWRVVDRFALFLLKGMKPLGEDVELLVP